MPATITVPAALENVITLSSGPVATQVRKSRRDTGVFFARSLLPSRKEHPGNCCPGAWGG
jgi:hypothetical protein